MRFASEDDLTAIFAPPDVPHIEIGTVHPTKGVRAPILFDLLLGRHFAVVGSSGSGKSTTVALMLDRIVAQAGRGHVVIFDPHGEYAHAFGDRAQVWDVGRRHPLVALAVVSVLALSACSQNDAKESDVVDAMLDAGDRKSVV